jgi:2-C-methyl-D-erythritol 4-phosphate cytidylyltransferase/2-C-methyl-D-erythritol 2,4-cyclodiphosphate synthase
MTVGAVVLAAGQGTRFGADKVWQRVGGKPLWQWSFESLHSHPEVDSVGIVVAESAVEECRRLAPLASFIVSGGENRTASSRIAVDASSTDAVLIQDGARAFVSEDVVSRVVAGIQRTGAAAPAVPLVDTIRSVRSDGIELMDRSRMRAMQTPQGALRAWLMDAFSAGGEYPDEMSMIEAIGRPWEMVEGDPRSLKVTHAGDLPQVRALLGQCAIRTGFGHDIHRFSGDASRPLMVGGVQFEGAGLEGHSDADALLHAVVDALLGAASLGDIGVHFPNSDPEWKDKPSIEFLKYAGDLIRSEGWQIGNIDATVVAERPKIMAHSARIRSMIASALGCNVDAVSVKATTNEGLGSIGRSEGLAAYAVATLFEA